MAPFLNRSPHNGAHFPANLRQNEFSQNLFFQRQSGALHLCKM